MSLTTPQVYAMLGNSPLWNTLQHCHQLFEQHQIPHALMGGVAVAMHGYQRNTIDVDFLIQKDAAPSVKQILADSGYLWDQQHIQFISPEKIPVQFLYARDKAGKDSEVILPNPADQGVTSFIHDIPVLSLNKLIESKLAAGEGDLRRTHKDFADVVELIIIHKLQHSFSSKLHKSVRKTFKQLVDRVQS